MNERLITTTWYLYCTYQWIIVLKFNLLSLNLILSKREKLYYYLYKIQKFYQIWIKISNRWNNLSIWVFNEIILTKLKSVVEIKIWSNI